jgi:glutathione S-transferase
MKLYFAPGACSLSPHIVLHELGLPFEAERMDGKTHTTASGADFYKINPQGQVPTLQLDDGEVLTEGAVIVQYLADQKPDAGLAPPNGTMPRYRLQEWLNFIATELHKTMSPLFNPKTPEEVRETQKQRLYSRYEVLEARLAKAPFLMGDFSVADPYLFTVMRWNKSFNIALDRWPSILAFMKRMESRPAVQAALAAEEKARAAANKS